MHALSVLIPTYNRRDLLWSAVSSALRQDCEVIVVDDASTDGTEALAPSLDRAGVRYVRLPENRGPCAARNIGVQLVTRPLILFLDDDDELLQDAAKIATKLADQHPEQQLFLHNCRYWDGHLSSDAIPALRRLDYEGWLRASPLPELKPVVRTDLFDRYQLEDTGASGEGLLWGKVIRDHGALISGQPIIHVETRHPVRLTAVSGLLSHASANAFVARRYLEEFGGDLAAVKRSEWRRRLVACSVYHNLGRERRKGLETIVKESMKEREPLIGVVALAVLLTPGSLLRYAFRRRARPDDTELSASFAR